MTTTTPPKLKTSAMIASFVDPGQRTATAPFGHALVQAAKDNDKIVGLSADLAKYTDMHIFAQTFPERFSRWAWPNSCCWAHPRAWPRPD